VRSYEKALKIKPDYKFLRGHLMHLRMRLSSWDGFEQELSTLCDSIRGNALASTPLPLQALVDDPALQRQCTVNYVQEKFPIPNTQTVPGRYAKHPKIRIGYFSSDFGNHPVTHLLAELFERHDRSQFEIFGFSLTRREGDKWQARVARACDHFFDVSDKTDAEVVALSRQREIDIAIDLNGHTKHARTAIFAQRAAPDSGKLYRVSGHHGGATASNALRAGLPVLTWMGKSFASRYGASLLNALDLPELIAEDAAQYEDLAVAFAENPRRLAEIRTRLALGLRESLLFDSTYFTQKFEAALHEMRARSIMSVPSDDIVIPR
jgi:predicted O-linked N-acetylglucosamine transferase (SPINDLY family)